MIEWAMDNSWARFRKGLFANGSEADPKGLEMAPKRKLGYYLCIQKLLQESIVSQFELFDLVQPKSLEDINKS